LTYTPLFGIDLFDKNILLTFYHPVLNLIVCAVNYCRIAFFIAIMTLAEGLPQLPNQPTRC
jgi:hypothetical protein